METRAPDRSRLLASLGWREATPKTLHCPSRSLIATAQLVMLRARPIQMKSYSSAWPFAASAAQVDCLDDSPQQTAIDPQPALTNPKLRNTKPRNPSELRGF